MRLSEQWDPRESPGSAGVGRSPGRIPVRMFLIVIISLVAAHNVWGRTGGDIVLSVASVPLFHGFLSYWLRD
jgi:hypothetical protein